MEKEIPKSKGYSMSGRGDVVRALRKEKGYSMEDLAANIDRSTKIIQGIESGEKNLTLDIAVCLCKEFKVSLDFLFGIEDRRDIEIEKMSIIDAIGKVIDFELLSDDVDSDGFYRSKFKINVNIHFLDYIRTLKGIVPLKEIKNGELYANAVNAIKEDYEQKIQECKNWRSFPFCELLIAETDNYSTKAYNAAKDDPNLNVPIEETDSEGE